jgi:NADPH-dependent ferric siderophore reductase
MPATSAGLTDRLLDQFFLTGIVEDVAWITPRMRRITISGSELRGVDCTPGQQVRVCVVTPRSWLGPLTTVLRTYSIWDYGDERLSLCVLDHGDGPGTTWAREVRPGHNVRFSRPKGDFTLRPAAHYVFIGEETASVAFGMMLRTVPPQATVQGVIEVDHPSDRLPLPRGEELTWRHRHGATAASSQPLADAVATLEAPPAHTGPAVAYVAGEARTCQAVRRRLITEHGWNRRSVLVKPFWTPGKRGME